MLDSSASERKAIKTANGVQDGSAFVKQIELLRLFYGYRQPTKAEDLYNGSTVFAARNRSDQSWRMDGYDRCASRHDSPMSFQA